MQGGKRKRPRNYIGACGNIYGGEDLFALMKSITNYKINLAI